MILFQADFNFHVISLVDGLLGRHKSKSQSFKMISLYMVRTTLEEVHPYLNEMFTAYSQLLVLSFEIKAL